MGRMGLMGLPLAQFPHPPIESVGLWVWSAFAALAGVVLLLTAIVQFRHAFGRSPTVDQILGSLATLKHVDDTNSRVTDLTTELHTRSRGLEEQISGLRHEMRGEYQATTAATQELREEMAEQMLGVRTKIEASFKELDNKRSASIGNLHGQLSEAKVQLGEVKASLAATSQATERKIDSMDHKLDRLVERSLNPHQKGK